MKKSQLFVIGGQRCGTTFLYSILDSHPEIEMAKPVRPEPKFFLNEDDFKKGKEFYERKYFSSLLPTIKVIGEKGTSYIEYPIVAERIKSFYPEAKIIVILRNPIERAISNYFFSLENGIETRSIDEVFLENAPIPNYNTKISVSPFNYLERGIYTNFLPPFIKEFNENLKIILFEDLFLNSETYIDLYSFLKVENLLDTEQLKVKVKVNESKSRDNKNINPEIYNFLTKYYISHNIALEKLINKKINW